MKKITNSILFVFFIGALIHIFLDAIKFHDIVESQKKSHSCCSWYDKNWIKMPYTNFMLMTSPSQEYWTKNGVGTPVFVKDVQYEGVGFWTELQRNSEN